MPAAVSLIDEHGSQRVRMRHLAFVGSHRINGVSALHTELMRQTTFRQLHELYADRIVNKTNGITFRRWLMQANPGLTKLLVEVCGAAVLDDQTAIVRLADHADDASLQERFGTVKRANKVALGRLIYERIGLRVDPDALFDVQIKRIHEYKRQLLNLLETIALYAEMRTQPNRSWVPRVKIFGGKAAASYTQAKLIIKLANDVAAVVNNDPAVRDMLKVAFIPNYNVSLAESIIPAADLSEQISTAGMEASGTGNMKLALNGALTIGTLDGGQYRDSRSCRGGQHLYLRSRGARGGAAPPQRMRCDSHHRCVAAARRGGARARIRLVHRRRRWALYSSRECLAASRLLHEHHGFRRLLWSAAPDRPAVAISIRLGAHEHP